MNRKEKQPLGLELPGAPPVKREEVVVCSAHTWGSAYRPVPVILTMMCPHMELPVGEAASGWWEGKGWPLIFRDKAPGMRAALKRPECVACPLSSPQLCLSSGFKIKSFPQVKLAN